MRTEVYKDTRQDKRSYSALASLNSPQLPIRYYPLWYDLVSRARSPRDKTPETPLNAFIIMDDVASSPGRQAGEWSAVSNGYKKRGDKSPLLSTMVKG